MASKHETDGHHCKGSFDACRLSAVRERLLGDGELSVAVIDDLLDTPDARDCLTIDGTISCVYAMVESDRRVVKAREQLLDIYVPMGRITETQVRQALCDRRVVAHHFTVEELVDYALCRYNPRPKNCKWAYWRNGCACFA